MVSPFPTRVSLYLSPESSVTYSSEFVVVDESVAEFSSLQPVATVARLPMRMNMMMRLNIFFIM